MKTVLIFSILFLQTGKSYSNDSLAFYFNNGKKAYRQNNFIEAITQYDMALKLDSTFYTARFARGLAYYEMQRFDDAMSDFNKCIILNPKDKNVYLQRGILHATMSEYGRALMDFEMCRKLDPTDSEIYLYIEHCKLYLHGF